MLGASPLGAAPLAGEVGGGYAPPPAARLLVSGPFGVPAFTGKPVTPLARLSVPGPLGTPAARALHDFSGLIGEATTHYVMDLHTPAGPLRVPISSWQATLQAGASNYVQCVVPACAPWAEAINTATAFVIYRTAAPLGAPVIEYEMTRAPAEQVQFDQGPARYTCTLSGYTAGFLEGEEASTAYDRVLLGVRSVSSGTGGQRVRCAVDWLLRPGHRAIVRGEAFVVAYINYYSPSGFDSYMDVGSRT